MRSVPKPHQPPHLLSFGISMFLYRKEKLYRSSISIREDINMKKLFFRALPESPNTPHPPNLGNLVLFFGRQKQRFARMTLFFGCQKLRFAHMTEIFF